VNGLDKINWNDLKAAFRVASLGSLAKAANTMNVNHTTVLRAINRLEESLQCKLFIRHQRGYELTDTGQMMLLEMRDIEAGISHLCTAMSVNTLQVKGTLRITTLPEYSNFLHSVLKKSLQLYPELRILVDSSDEIVPLESGQAHISIRAGKQPKEPDVIARKLSDIRFSYYASTDYIQRYGLPMCASEYNQHVWIMPTGRKQQIPFISEVLVHLDKSSIGYESNNFADIQAVVEAGIGIGPIDDRKAAKLKQVKRLSFIENTNDSGLWFVYHRDLKNDIKVKAMLQLLLEVAQK